MAFAAKYLVAIPLGLSVALATIGPAFAGQVLTGRPTHVTDGDTFRFGTIRVRLAGIDAPELATPAGAPARAYLAALIEGKALSCADSGERSYDRVVATCRTPTGDDVALAMVSAGWAFDWPTYSHGAYQSAEVKARLARRGMFKSDPLAQRPLRRPGGR